MKKTLQIGMTGSGFMGRCHANAFGSVAGLFDLPATPVKNTLADATDERAKKGAEALGFAKGTSDWQSMINSDEIDIVSITAPNVLHEPMAMAAIAAGKTVYCEKPLSTTAASALKMTEAAEAAGVTTMVGFNFLRNPMVKFAKELVEAGEIGEVTSFRGIHAENYMADPNAPHSFRTDPQGGGALADIGSHIISMSRYILGPISKVDAKLQTIYPERPLAEDPNKKAPVLVDDAAYALVEFESGVCGTIEANWAATGRTMGLSFEITGSKGAIHFTQERMNELQLYKPNGAKSGYTKIEAGPAHKPYGNFCPAAGHHLGFNDLKVIEVAELIEAHCAGTNGYPDFREAYEVQKVVEAMQNASREGGM